MFLAGNMKLFFCHFLTFNTNFQIKLYFKRRKHNSRVTLLLFSLRVYETWSKCQNLEQMHKIRNGLRRRNVWIYSLANRYSPVVPGRATDVLLVSEPIEKHMQPWERLIFIDSHMYALNKLIVEYRPVTRCKDSPSGIQMLSVGPMQSNQIKAMFICKIKRSGAFIFPRSN